MKVRTEMHYVGEWTAIDEDTYDGAPDAGHAGMIGWGATEQEAIEDLQRLFRERAEANEERT